MFFKKTISITASILLFLCTVPNIITAYAAYSGNYRYTVTDGCAVIEKYLGTESEITVPSELDGYPVTKIASYAFSENRNIYSLTVADSVTDIENGAFSSCVNLRDISLPDSITSIGSEILYGTLYESNPLNWESGLLYVGNCLIEAKPEICGKVYCSD